MKQYLQRFHYSRGRKVAFRWVTYPPSVWLGSLFGDELKVFTTPEGELIEKHIEAETHGSKTEQFKGKVCFLIGTITFSSAVELVDAVMAYNLATPIGEETCSVPTSFGDGVSFRLPMTGLEVSVASAKYVRANGDTTSCVGVVPDINVRQSGNDIGKPYDPVLERAKQWILNQAELSLRC